jgi:hypothetical protein
MSGKGKSRITIIPRFKGPNRDCTNTFMQPITLLGRPDG